MLEPISNLSLNFAIEQSTKQRNLGARARVRPLANGNMKGGYVFDHGARFEFVKRASGELDAEAGQETFVGRCNDTRSDSSAVSQTVKRWSRSDVENVSGGEPTENRGFGTANRPRP